MSSLVERSESFVRQFIDKTLPANMFFHHIGHAEDVVYAVNEIGINSSLRDEDLVALKVAAWFHDTGYCYGYYGHERSSMDIADGFLENEKCGKPFIKKVLNCIWSTRFPQEPENVLEQIICDADLYHFSRKDYMDYATALRAEWATVLNKTFSDDEWNLMNLKLLLKHQFHSRYGQSVLESRKQQNINRLRFGVGQQ
jgi:uncharacterized protein